jgi:hypothetical protein
MQPLTVDLHGITSDHLRLTDKPVLSAVVMEAIDPTRPIVDGAGFDNET